LAAPPRLIIDDIAVVIRRGEIMRAEIGPIRMAVATPHFVRHSFESAQFMR
jgi:hypothetical protein